MLSFKEIISLDKTESTNLYAKDLMAQKPNINFIVKSKYQTKGQGLATNQWHSENQKNLLLTFCLKPVGIKAENQFIISKVISVVLVKLFSQFTNKKTHIKWPNDIYIEDRKITGILIENFVSGNSIDKCICGIGINVNQTEFPKWVPNPISIAQLTNQEHDLDRLFNKLLDLIDVVYDSIINEVIDIDKEYKDHLYRLDKWATFARTSNNLQFVGKICDIDNYGRIIIEQKDGSKEVFGFKEIKFIL
jgi:BirA family biotin operon repressor/biotin-[acetyl-CoA-carboxylase] ligase